LSFLCTRGDAFSCVRGLCFGYHKKHKGESLSSECIVVGSQPEIISLQLCFLSDLYIVIGLWKKIKVFVSDKQKMDWLFVETDLSIACGENSLIKVSAHFEQGMCKRDLRSQHIHPYSALHIVCWWRGNIDIVESFLDHDVALCMTTSDYNLPSLLVFTCIGGSNEPVCFAISMLLMDQGFDIYETNKHSFYEKNVNLLRSSALNNNITILRTLYDRGIYASDINCKWRYG